MIHHISTSRLMRRRAIAIAVSALALVTAGINTANAQSNATGTVYGTVQAGSGVTVLIENLATGLKRTLTPDAIGQFTATALPPGTYKATQLRSGQPTGAASTVEVLLGQGVEAVFAGSAQVVTVTGSARRLDMSATSSGSTFTARQLDALPIEKNLTSILLLAPDTVKADPRYAGGASIGGGAPSENSYYINGFPVTNPLSQLGSMELPFGAIQQAQIMTGGFGAEFGRSTGGVVNIITKSGGNSWQGGASLSIAPNSLRSKQRNQYYGVTGDPVNAATDGKLYRWRQDNSRDETQIGAYVGGPIIQDKLFMFVAFDQTKANVKAVSNLGSLDLTGNVISSTLGTNGWIERVDTNQRYLAKFDWNLTDNHRLEFTTLGDNYETDQNHFKFDYKTLAHSGPSTYHAYFKNEPNLTTGVGGAANILKYTGNLTPDFVLTALYGESRSPHREIYTPDFGTSIAGSIFATGTGRAPGIDYGSAQPLSGQNLDPASAEDKTKSYRLDVEYALGKHTIRAGLDENRLSSANAGQMSAGGSVWSYRFTSTPLGTRTFGPYRYVVADGSALGNLGYYVRQRTFSSVTDAKSDQSAQYIEDRWQLSKNLLLTLGLRNESFKGYNGENQLYIDSKNFLSPRVGASWDLQGDRTLKLFGTAGRYSIQTPTHVAVRGAGVSTLVDQFFTYTGVDANGIPTGLHKLTAQPFSPDGETGLPKDPNSVAAKDLKPSYQDELILGIEKALTKNLNVGGKVTYRQLGATLDDMCDDRPFKKYADDHGIDRSKFAFNCLSINPGQTNKFLIDYAGTKTYTPVTLSAADLGFDKPKRTFFALDFFVEHPFSDGWYGKLTYTWSQSKGNTEGQTKSDNAQTDVAATSTWDFKEIMENTYGYLPSDRRHQIKAIGLYQFAPQWMIGGNALVSSGRPKNCIGNYAGTSPDGDFGGYGSIFFFCNGVPTPRGSEGRLPWEYTFDMNLTYQPTAVKGLKLRVDVFNLFNRQSALAGAEIHENSGDATSVLPTYGRVIGYTAPRAFKLTAQYDF